jgi:hypothetical protein
MSTQKGERSCEARWELSVRRRAAVWGQVGVGVCGRAPFGQKLGRSNTNVPTNFVKAGTSQPCINNTARPFDGQNGINLRLHPFPVETHPAFQVTKSVLHLV